MRRFIDASPRGNLYAVRGTAPFVGRVTQGQPLLPAHWTDCCGGWDPPYGFIFALRAMVDPSLRDLIHPTCFWELMVVAVMGA